MLGVYVCVCVDVLWVAGWVCICLVHALEHELGLAGVRSKRYTAQTHHRGGIIIMYYVGIKLETGVQNRK